MLLWVCCTKQNHSIVEKNGPSDKECNSEFCTAVPPVEANPDEPLDSRSGDSLWRDLATNQKALLGLDQGYADFFGVCSFPVKINLD
jgi:hypothetical protein